MESSDPMSGPKAEIPEPRRPTPRTDRSDATEAEPAVEIEPVAKRSVQDKAAPAIHPETDRSESTERNEPTDREEPTDAEPDTDRFSPTEASPRV